MPMELTMVGRPDVEVGDVFNIILGTGQSFVGFVETRELSGIQALYDEIESTDEDMAGSQVRLGGYYDEETGTLTLYTEKQ